MRILDKVKDLKKDLGDSIDRFASKPEYQYERAYLKGVDVQDYESAVKDFSDSSKKFLKIKNNDMALRAKANSNLYQLINSKDRSIINEVIPDLEALPEIEQFGIGRTLVQTYPFVVELKAIQLEYQAEQTQSNDEKRELYSQARDLLMKLDNNTLSFADKIEIQGPIDKALSRACYYGAFSDFYGGIIESMISPANAYGLLNRSLKSFEEAGAIDRSSEVKNYINNIELKRHCWMCGREMQGRNIHYHYYPTNAAKYQKNLLEASGDDIRMLDRDGYVTLCTVCGSIIEKQADIYSEKRVKEMLDYVNPILDDLASSIDWLERRINSLENVQNEIENTQRDLESKQEELKKESSKSHTARHYDKYGNMVATSYSDGGGHTRTYDARGNKITDSYEK